tara:strand:- start:10455 stop:11675 length:1221 start_codon:yes stop_codon:yes gene_type:complete
MNISLLAILSAVNVFLFILSIIFIILYVSLKIHNSKLKEEFHNAYTENRLLKDNKEFLLDVSDKYKAQFENFANQVMSNNTEKFEKYSVKNIDNILSPLKENIKEFKAKIETSYYNEAKERSELKTELKAELNRIIRISESMKSETHNLTEALKGSTKAQGNWGEMVLEKLLELSGLREGFEYISQGKDLKLQDEQGKRLLPDVIINLPDNKHIIIDSKVSLVHYQQYLASDNNDSKKQEYLNLFIKSIYNHINNLSSKKYEFADKIISPEFVVLFFPIEGAFSFAMQQDPEIFNKAWRANIVIVSPTTLFATLKTVASVWAHEKRNKNALKIAEESGALYDKFVSFLKDLEEIGVGLKKSDQAYHNAINKLHIGRGNLVSKVEKIKNLGAKTKKNISDKLLSSVD